MKHNEINDDEFKKMKKEYQKSEFKDMILDSLTYFLTQWDERPYIMSNKKSLQEQEYFKNKYPEKYKDLGKEPTKAEKIFYTILGICLILFIIFVIIYTIYLLLSAIKTHL